MAQSKGVIRERASPLASSRPRLGSCWDSCDREGLTGIAFGWRGDSKEGHKRNLAGLSFCFDLDFVAVEGFGLALGMGFEEHDLLDA